MVILHFAGCTTAPPKQDETIVADEQAAELAELFAGLGEEEPAAPTPTGKQPSVPAEFAEDEIDPLKQIAATAPRPVLEAPGRPTDIRIYDWKVIDGAPVGNFFTGVNQYRFKLPVAIAVRSEYLYVVDEGAAALYRYDIVSGRMEALLDLKREVTGRVADIYVARDFSFYLTDTEGARVIHYNRHGGVIQIYRNFYNLVRPVAVTELENGDVVVADEHYDHLLQFNRMGKLIATHGRRGEGVAEFLNITTMTLGPDGFYVGSRIGRRLQVLGLDGIYRYSFQEGTAVFPVSIAVDRYNRSYIADMMDNTIKVFDRGSFIGIIGGFGAETGKFKRITDVWLDESILYIVDSLNGRIQAARLSPEPIILPTPQSGPTLIEEVAPEIEDMPLSEPVSDAPTEPAPESAPQEQ